MKVLTRSAPSFVEPRKLLKFLSNVNEELEEPADTSPIFIKDALGFALEFNQVVKYQSFIRGFVAESFAFGLTLMSIQKNRFSSRSPFGCYISVMPF